MLDEAEVERSEPDGGPRPRLGLSRAVVLLCGTGTYARGAKLANIPAVKATLTDLAEVLTDRCGAPAPTVVSDPPTLTHLGEAVSKAARRADDVLLIYYVGHGLVSSDGSLYLAAAGTSADADSIEHTALRYETVRHYVRNSPATTKIVILDCCYSGIAVGNLGAHHDRDQDMENRAVIEGAYVLTSAAPDGAAIAPPGAHHTAFSGALIQLLTDGDPRGGPEITLNSAYEYLSRELPAAGYPRPHQRVTDTADQVVLAHNPARPGVSRGRRTLSPPRRRVRLPIVVAAVLAGIAAVPVLLSLRYGGSWRPPPAGVRGDVLHAWWGRLLLAVTAVVVTLVVAGPAAHWITRVAIRSRRRRLRRFRVPLLGVMAFGLAALLGGTALTTGASARVWLGGCPATAIVTVLAPVDSGEPARELANAFERDTAADNFGCPVARVLVSTATAAEIDTALVHGWGEAEHVRIGPVPDVWLPDWSGEFRQAMAEAAGVGRTLPVRDVRTVASTPLVLAVPAGPAGIDVADGTAWPGVLTKLQDRGWGLVVPDPQTSLGALARVPLYHPAIGRTSVTAVERYVDQSFDRGKFTLGADAAALLCAPGAARDRTAYVVSEQDVARFDHNDPLGPSCPQRPPERLRAVYAADTPVLDRQAVRFEWPQTSDERRRAAIRFTEWLGRAAGRQALAAAGLRPPGPVAGAPLGPDWGVQPDLRPRPAVISADLVADARLRYGLAHRYGRVVIAIDASGSMGLPAFGGSLWQVAARGAAQAGKLTGGRDELGVWAFQGRSVRRLVRLRPAGSAGPAAIATALDRVRPRGPAPLYNAIASAVAEAGPSNDERVTAVIVLTDGENDNASVLDTRQFRTAVEGKGVRVFAVAMGATGCAAPVLKTITSATAGTCLEAEPGTVAEPMATIFEAVL